MLQINVIGIPFVDRGSGRDFSADVYYGFVVSPPPSHPASRVTQLKPDLYRKLKLLKVCLFNYLITGHR